MLVYHREKQAVNTICGTKALFIMQAAETRPHSVYSGGALCYTVRQI